MTCRFYIDMVGLADAMTIVGWAFATHGRIERISLSWGESCLDTVPGQYGDTRTDVAQAHRVSPGCGFNIMGVPLKNGATYRLTAHLSDGTRWDHAILELRLRDGEWSCTSFGFGPAQIRRCPAATRFASLGSILARYAPQPAVLPPLEKPTFILVGVYRGQEYYEGFFNSLFANTSSPYHLVLVDDGNRNPDITAALEAQKSRGERVSVITLDQNVGHIEAVSRGFELWRGEHVVWANIDTILPPHWLERLVGPMLADPSIASTTPFANSASICGFPHMPGDNPIYLGLDSDQVDAAFAGLAPDGVAIDLPSGVGFCMGMNSRAIDRIGFLERGTFGAGYGEENDWCQKALRAGMRNVLVPNLFVYHKHGGSFPSDAKQRLIERNLKIIRDRYPHYDGDVRDHILADPAGTWRRFVAFVLAARHHDQGAMLFVSGAAAPPPAMAERIEACAAQGQPLVLMTQRGFQFLYTFLWAGGRLDLPAVSLAELPLLARRLRLAGAMVGALSSSPCAGSLERAASALAVPAIAEMGTG
jgi:GT2 family glycosyltransferase